MRSESSEPEQPEGAEGAESASGRPPRPVLLTVALAAVVVVASLVAAVLLRPGDEHEAADGLSMPTPTAADGCGGGPCRVVASASVNGMTVELLAAERGSAGRLRAGGPASASVAEVAIGTMGVPLNQDSLRCKESATPVCLVRGPHDGGMVGELHVWQGDSWRSDQRPYFSDAGSVTLDDVDGDAVPEVVVVSHDCSDVDSVAACREAPVLAEVFDLSGGTVGCTGTYGSPGSLRGWPEVDVESYELMACS
ncbi:MULTISPECIES: hypothetical protein [Prauserella salsuginis group]|uniref:Uncharacterized protein n=2 Tax=Prauserella salsuginis group TaxID=2893672 RepID=A0A839XKB1_9PSEU|nr:MULTISPECIES: hypothetical protein [Prauserella salsuginis group]MBB3661954.1 hypothetical protein [Prauserella sediminis]MCR3722670.1 hypothetical protein [Prauserella flava]MCR3737275.1 hypothetical protein [Prauserella salsuginis]